MNPSTSPPPLAPVGFMSTQVEIIVDNHLVAQLLEELWA
jgi:hypothetical protein